MSLPLIFMLLAILYSVGLSLVMYSWGRSNGVDAGVHWAFEIQREQLKRDVASRALDDSESESFAPLCECNLDECEECLPFNIDCYGEIRERIGYGLGVSVVIKEHHNPETEDVLETGDGYVVVQDRDRLTADGEEDQPNE